MPLEPVPPPPGWGEYDYYIVQLPAKIGAVIDHTTFVVQRDGTQVTLRDTTQFVTDQRP